jgi:arsenite-transporting ATPase
LARKRRARLILCSGKGGTGKSTVAAAIATHFADERHKTLLVSSDPTRSLSGIFNRKIGGKLTKLGRNLHAQEMDVEKIAKRVEEEYRKIFVDALASWLDEEIMKDLPLEMISGVDELFALDKIRHFVEQDYDVVVWDTSPTAHTLRLLSLSKKVSTAMSRSLGLYVKLIHPLQTIRLWFKGRREPKIIEAFKGLGETTVKIEKMLADARTELILVLNPELLSISEGRQLRGAAERYNITIKRAVVNKMITPCKCRFCDLKRKEQQKNMAIIQKECSDLRLLTVPYLPHEIITMERVKEYARKLFE